MLNQLKYFQAVVRRRSFSKAAEECFISQSAVSQQVRALEREVGAELLHREGRGFSLTPAGELLYRKSLGITAEWDKLCRDVQQLESDSVPRLLLGCLRSYAGPEFHRAVAAFSQRHSKVELQLTTGNHEELYGLLVSGQVDLLLSDQRRAFSQGYYNEILTARPYQAELVAHHPIAQRESATVEGLREFPCIVVSSPEQWDNEHDYYREIVGLQGKFYRVGSLEEGRLLAVAGKGFLLVEGGGGVSESPGLRRIPLLRNGEQLLHNYCAFWSRENSGYYVEEFAGLLREQFPEQSEN